MNVPALETQYLILEVIQWIKNPALDYLMLAITMTGSETFYSIMLVLLFWYSKEKEIFFSTFMLLITFILMDVLKHSFGMHRPIESEAAAMTHTIRMIGAKTGGGFGLPSGHTMGSVIFWYYIFHFYESRWIKRTALFFIILVPFSRLYLGVHFPLDVLAGYFFALTIISLAAFIHLYQRSMSEKYLWPLGFTAMGVIVIAWMTYPTETVIKSSGSLAGLLAAGIQSGSFSSQKRRFTISSLLIGFFGLIIIFALKAGLKAFFGFIFPFEMLAHFLRYFLIIYTGFLVVPLVMRKAASG